MAVLNSSFNCNSFSVHYMVNLLNGLDELSGMQTIVETIRAINVLVSGCIVSLDFLKKNTFDDYRFFLKNFKCFEVRKCFGKICRCRN